MNLFYIVPALFLVVVVVWGWQFRNKHQNSVLWYTPLYYWRRFVLAVQPSGMDNLEDGIVILDRNYRVVDVNVMGEKLLEGTAVNLIGHPITTICTELANNLDQAAQGKLEVICNRHTPTQTFQISLKELKNWRKKANGFILIIRDISEQKSLDRIRRDMTHTLVHDLRAPLSNSIFALQMLEMQLNGSATPETTKMIDLTISNTEKVLDRVNKILDVERLESNQMPLALTAVFLPDVIENVLESQTSRIEEKKLDIATYVPDELALVFADASLLERVLQNLLDNSIKFTPSGGEIVLAVTAVPQSQPPIVHISISDTGTGIPTELQSTVFDKFASVTEKGGSGLGLAFCKMALSAHDQDIWAESEPGHGSIFTFSLALAPQPQPQLPPPVPA